MNMYWELCDLDYKSKIDKLKGKTHEELVMLYVNNLYNEFMSKYADYEEEENPVDPNIPNGKCFGKRIPYYGWFWRPVDFYNKDITLGIEKEFKGFMLNDEWDYPVVKMKEEQFSQMMEIIDKAMRFAGEGDCVSETRKNIVGELEKLWPFFQEFKVKLSYELVEGSEPSLGDNPIIHFRPYDRPYGLDRDDIRDVKVVNPNITLITMANEAAYGILCNAAEIVNDPSMFSKEHREEAHKQLNDVIGNITPTYMFIDKDGARHKGNY